MRTFARLFVCTLALVALSQPAEAATVTFNFNSNFSNATLPDGTPPWLVATISDDAMPGDTVRLTLQAVNLSATEFVSDFWFNLNPAINLASLLVTPVNVAAVGSVTITKGTNCCTADGGGEFDLKFGFPTSAAGRFTNGETVVYDINGVGLDIFDFLFQSTNQGGNGPFYAAAHIQGIDGGAGSTFVAPNADGVIDPRVIDATVPEPASLMLLGTGLALFARQLRRRA